MEKLRTLRDGDLTRYMGHETLVYCGMSKSIGWIMNDNV